MFKATPVLLLLLLACGQPADDAAAGGARLEVVCTTGMVADLVRNVGGERVSVTGLMGPGVDPHYYKASQGDLARLGDADLIVYNGLYLEGKMQSIFEKMARTRTVVAITDVLPRPALRQPPDYEGHYDPHVWFDVGLWAQTIDAVVDVLAAADPDGAAAYRRRGEEYRSELRDLDAWVLDRIEEIPPSQRLLVTAHDAFGYFGQAYGVEVLGLQGISTVAEYGVNDVTQLVDTIVERGVKAVFVESSVPQRSIEAVQAGCEARGHDVAIGGELYSDAMGGPGSDADTYTGMVRSNVNTLVEALR